MESTSEILKRLNQMFTLQWHLAKSPDDQIQANDAAGNPTIVDRTQFNRTLESIYNQIRQLSVQPVESKFGYAYYMRDCHYLLAIDNDPVKLLNLLKVEALRDGENENSGIIRITPGEVIFCTKDEDFIFDLDIENIGEIETRGKLAVTHAPKGNLSSILYILLDDSEDYGDEFVVVFERENEAKTYRDEIYKKLKDDALDRYGEYDYEEIPINRYRLGTIDPNLKGIENTEESKTVDITKHHP